MQLLLVTVMAGAFVSTTTYAVLSRVRTQNPSGAPHDWANVGSSSHPDKRDAAQEIAMLIGLDPSGIDVMLTGDHEVHCSIQAGPDELFELTKAADAVIDQAFRERHQWQGLRVVLHLEARPKTNGCQASNN